MKKMTSLACIIVILSGILLSGCGGSGSPEADHSGPKRDSTPQVLTPTADGAVGTRMTLQPLMPAILLRAM